MAFTDPRLGPLGTNLLRLGYSAQKILAELAASDPYIEHRQFCVIDRDGHAVARTGRENKVWSGAFTEKNMVAMGNNLTSEETARVMYDVWTQTGALPLEERLLAALEAGGDAGGQNGGQHSAALVVYGGDINAYIDLRVDEHTEPVAELRRIYEAFKPLVPCYYVRPGSDPSVLGREAEWLARQ